MPSADWNAFEQLQGSADTNFETLCRSLVRLHYGKHGTFLGSANQPGVEFHLKLESDCALGSKGEWIGWQCRWYSFSKPTALGSARRSKILDSIKKSEKHVPGLTRWILWTRLPLTKADEKWYSSIKSPMKLELWTHLEAECLLSGYAEILRGTYFGELVLSYDSLKSIHAKSVASIGNRWIPGAHQEVAAERRLRQILGDALAWEDLGFTASELRGSVAMIRNNSALANGEPFGGRLRDFVSYAESVAEVLSQCHALLTKGDLDLLQQILGKKPSEPGPEHCSIPRLLRAARSPLAFICTNCLADLKQAHRLLLDVSRHINTRIVAIVADAGGGKTQLSAQLSAEDMDRPPGILLFGRDLHRGQSLDDLACRISIHAKPVPSMESLVAALDAAGQRSKRRLPIVIDGLNEAEDPRDWKPLLAGLEIILSRYANVLVVCTLRTGSRRPAIGRWNERPAVAPETRAFFADMALPDSVARIEMDGFGSDIYDAIRKYFQFYKINPGDVELPLDLLSHPLQLRLYCEVTNPSREKPVGVEGMPRTLAGLFERYLVDATKRVATLAPVEQPYYALDVANVLKVIGVTIWKTKAREIGESELRRAVGDENRLWKHSIIQLLEQEGVILRVEGATPGTHNIIAVYDALAGYLAADAMLKSQGREGFIQWIKAPETLTAFQGEYNDLHPLSVDIFRALASLVPRNFGADQLWPHLEGPLRSTALLAAMRLEGEYLDASTVSEIAKLVHQQDGSKDVLAMLRRSRSSPNHPLNADFLDAQLRKMSNPDRDLRWTEWCRMAYEENPDLSDLGAMWQTKATRTPADRLRAKWYMWLLTSTAHELRNKATRALFWFGRKDAKSLFQMTLASLEIGDPYVPERMLAASYGVAMAAYAERNTILFPLEAFAEFRAGLYEKLFSPDAKFSTTHVLMREYASRILELAAVITPDVFSKQERSRLIPPYNGHCRFEWKEDANPRDEIHGIKSPFRMDFENYTLGALVPGRGNYDFSNKQYRKVRAQVLWRIGQLGWTDDRFQTTDQQISSRSEFRRVRDDSRKIERYGKKYSWIAYHEMVGHLSDNGQLKNGNQNDRAWYPDIDPSFPKAFPNVKLLDLDLLELDHAEDVTWLEDPRPPKIGPHLRQIKVLDQPGPWVVLDGFLSQDNKKVGRHLFAFVRTFLIKKSNKDALLKALKNQSMRNHWLPHKLELRQTYVGEVPWCRTFPAIGSVPLRFLVKETKQTVKRLRYFHFLDGKKIGGPEYYKHSIQLMRLKMGFDDAIRLGDEDFERIVTKRMLVDVEETKQKFVTYKVRMPVNGMSSVGEKVDDLPVHESVLSKEIIQALDASIIPQSFNFASHSGEQITNGVSYRANAPEERQEFYFIRQQELDRYLKESDYSMVCVVWGERQTIKRVRNGILPGGAKFHVFSDVFLYRS